MPLQHSLQGCVCKTKHATKHLHYVAANVTGFVCNLMVAGQLLPKLLLLIPLQTHIEDDEEDYESNEEAQASEDEDDEDDDEEDDGGTGSGVCCSCYSPS